MNPELFKTLGQWAGIGGIALGVLLILFQELIRKSIFPKLQKADAYKFLRLITVLTWSVAVLGICAWVWMETHPKIETEATVNSTPPVVDTEPPAKVEVDHGVGAGRDVNVKGDIIIDGEKKKTKK